MDNITKKHLRNNRKRVHIAYNPKKWDKYKKEQAKRVDWAQNEAQYEAEADADMESTIKAFGFGVKVFLFIVMCVVLSQMETQHLVTSLIAPVLNTAIVAFLIWGFVRTRIFYMTLAIAIPSLIVFALLDPIIYGLFFRFGDF